MGFTQLFSGVLTILITLAFMFSQNAMIALVVVAVTPLSLFVARFIAQRTYAMFRLQSQTRGEQTAFIDERIGNLKVVQAYGREAAETARFDEINGRLKDCSMRATFFSSLTNPCTRFVNSVVYALVALAGALSALTPGSAMTVGTLTAFLSYANQYTKPFNEISGVVTELQNALACAARIFELIDAEPIVPDPEDAVSPESTEGRFSLEHVRFSYDPAELSVTVNGEELGSKFSKGPFVITKKVDKKVRFKLARVDYNEWNNTSRYTSDYEDFVTAGTSVAKVLPEVDKSTVKLTKTSLVYNGKAQTVQVSDIKDKDGNVIDPKYYDVTGNKKTKAGNYIAKVSFKEPYTGEVSLKWSITPKKLTVSGLKFKDKFYDGSKYMVLASQTPQVSGVISGDKVTVKTTRADYVITGTKSAGSKKRKLTVGSFVLSGADAANYKLSAGVTVTGTIKKVTVSKVTLTKNEVSYTGAAQKPVIKVITGNDGKKILAKNCTIKYLRDGKETTDFTSRGTITVSVTGATNWKGTASATYTIR